MIEITTVDHERWCNQCRRRAHDKSGILLCSLTWKPPSFIDSCPSFSIETRNEAQKLPLLNAQTAAVSLWIRILNLAIDLICIYLFGFIMGPVLGLLSVSFSFTELWANLSFAILFLFYFIAYYFLFEISWSRTIGKLITGTMVVNLYGRMPTITQIIVRSITRLIPIDPFTFFGNRSTGWHDSFSGTRVIKVSVLKKARSAN